MEDTHGGLLSVITGQMAILLPAILGSTAAALTGEVMKLANGITLHYETAGTGHIPVILVHGYGMSSAVWKKSMPLFPAAYRCFAIDMRGFGASDKPEKGYRCAELADDLAQLMDALHLPRAVIIGHSFGGQVVQHFAARYPDRALALVLCNTVAATAQPQGLDSVVKKRIQGYGSAAENRKVFSASIPRYFDPSCIAPDDVEYFIQVGLQAGNTALRETLEANYTTPAIPADRFAALNSPSLIVVSTHDPFGTFDHAVAMTDALPGSHIEVLERCGHTPMWERPSEFVRMVTRFLSGAGLE